MMLGVLNIFHLQKWPALRALGAENSVWGQGRLHSRLDSWVLWAQEGRGGLVPCWTADRCGYGCTWRVPQWSVPEGDKQGPHSRPGPGTPRGPLGRGASGGPSVRSVPPLPHRQPLCPPLPSGPSTWGWVGLPWFPLSPLTVLMLGQALLAPPPPAFTPLQCRARPSRQGRWTAKGLSSHSGSPEPR